MQSWISAQFRAFRAFRVFRGSKLFSDVSDRSQSSRHIPCAVHRIPLRIALSRTAHGVCLLLLSETSGMTTSAARLTGGAESISESSQLTIRPPTGGRHELRSFYHTFFCRFLQEVGRKMCGRKRTQNRASVSRQPWGTTRSLPKFSDVINAQPLRRAARNSVPIEA